MRLAKTGTKCKTRADEEEEEEGGGFIDCLCVLRVF